MEHYLNCKKIDTAIKRAKDILIERAKRGGIYENFGADEARKIRDKFIDICDYSREMNGNRRRVDDFCEWCVTYTGR